MLIEYILFSLKSLRQYKLRAFLTVLGVMIGVFSIVAIITIGQGGKELILSELGRGGTNLIVAHSNQIMMETRQDKLDYLTEDQVRAMKRDIPGIEDVAPEYFLSTTMKVRGEHKLIPVLEVPANWFEMWKLDIVRGRIFTEHEVKSSQKVGIIGRDLFNSLFGGSKALGHQDVEVEGTYFRVIGIMTYKLKLGPWDLNNALILPSSALQRLLGADEIYEVLIRAKDGVSVPILKERIKRHLLKLFSDREGWEVTTMDEFIQIVDKVTDIISIVISSIAAISLVVGGIGIMNIMLVTVRERTREVGIRKAVGATRQNILYQFLTESLMLCLFGGIIGIGAAAGVILLIAKVMDLAISLSGGAILLGFTFSYLVGIFFGVYPAHLAARLNPVEALRYE
ncbi:MAG: ABC transporter permease [bacterium]|nr:ABC transporter permease [bacterium]